MTRRSLLFGSFPMFAAAILAPQATTAQIPVGDVEELYAEVNSSANAGATLMLSPGVYMLSRTNPFGVVRANGGRLDLQENMSLMGVEGDRSAVVIDAINLPGGSLTDGGVRIAAVRLGRGDNSIEWMTVRNARNGTANIDTTLQAPGTAFGTIPHVSSSGSQRGLDVLNRTAGSSGEMIEADIIDNDFFNNIGNPSQGLRVVNLEVVGS